MDVRRVQGPEWRALREVRLLALSEAPEAFETRYEEATARPDEWWIGWAERSAESEEQAMFVAWDGTTPLAVAGAFVEDQRCWLISMWTAPAVRRRGIGADLVESVARFARASRHTELLLKVKSDNEPARRFYERCGFLEVGGDGRERTMRLSL
jgi:ribosomal protein S18 acetylase RimI-like enzyme